MTTDNAPMDSATASQRYGAPASLSAGFRRFVAARATGHLLVANALTGPSSSRPRPENKTPRGKSS